MKHISLVFVTVLAFGCKKGGGDCAKAIDHSMELSKDMMSKMPGMDDKAMAKMHDLGIQHCKDDKWPDEAIKCMTDAKAMSDAQACYSKLSADQQQKMMQAMAEAMPKPAAAPAAPAAGSAGSATGSAP